MVTYLRHQLILKECEARQLQNQHEALLIREIKHLIPSNVVRIEQRNIENSLFGDIMWCCKFDDGSLGNPIESPYFIGQTLDLEYKDTKYEANIIKIEAKHIEDITSDEYGKTGLPNFGDPYLNLRFHLHPVFNRSNPFYWFRYLEEEI